jgi:hypothetical protein
MKRLILILLLASISTSLIAAGSIAARNISKVAFQSGGFFLYADEGWSNPNNCTRNHAIVLLDNDPNYEKAYALLLAAFMSGKKIQGYSNGCSDYDGQTYNTIRGYKYLVVH